MSIRVIFWGNSQSIFSSRHFEALLCVPCELAAVVDVPPSRRDSTNPLPSGLPDFVDVSKQKQIAVFAPQDPNDPGFVNALTHFSQQILLDGLAGKAKLRLLYRDPHNLTLELFCVQTVRIWGMLWWSTTF